MFEEMTLSNGSPWLSSFNCARSSSALIANSPRTAYCTFRTAGFSASAVRGRMIIRLKVWGRNRSDEGKSGEIDGRPRPIICPTSVPLFGNSRPELGSQNVVDRWRYFRSTSGRPVRNFRKIEPVVEIAVEFCDQLGVTTRGDFITAWSE